MSPNWRLTTASGRRMVRRTSTLIVVMSPPGLHAPIREMLRIGFGAARLDDCSDYTGIRGDLPDAAAGAGSKPAPHGARARRGLKGHLNRRRCAPAPRDHVDLDARAPREPAHADASARRSASLGKIACVDRVHSRVILVEVQEEHTDRRDV